MLLDCQDKVQLCICKLGKSKSSLCKVFQIVTLVTSSLAQCQAPFSEAFTDSSSASVKCFSLSGAWGFGKMDPIEGHTQGGIRLPEPGPVHLKPKQFSKHSSSCIGFCLLLCVPLFGDCSLGPRPRSGVETGLPVLACSLQSQNRTNKLVLHFRENSSQCF